MKDIKDIEKEQIQRLRVFNAIQEHLKAIRRDGTPEAIRMTEKWAKETLKRHGFN